MPENGNGRRVRILCLYGAPGDRRALIAWRHSLETISVGCLLTDSRDIGILFVRCLNGNRLA